MEWPTRAVFVFLVTFFNMAIFMSPTWIFMFSFISLKIQQIQTLLPIKKNNPIFYDPKKFSAKFIWARRSPEQQAPPPCKMVSGIHLKVFDTDFLWILNGSQHFLDKLKFSICEGQLKFLVFFAVITMRAIICTNKLQKAYCIYCTAVMYSTELYIVHCSNVTVHYSTLLYT